MMLKMRRCISKDSWKNRKKRKKFRIFFFTLLISWTSRQVKKWLKNCRSFFLNFFSSNFVCSLSIELCTLLLLWREEKKYFLFHFLSFWSFDVKVREEKAWKDKSTRVYWPWGQLDVCGKWQRGKKDFVSVNTCLQWVSASSEFVVTLAKAV